MGDQLEAITTEIGDRSTPRRRSSGNLLRQARVLHLYLGIFFAPSIFFFALTGAAQVLNLHETEPGSTYHPPSWLEKMAQVHKKQTTVMRPKNAAPRNAPKEGEARRGEGDRPRIAQPPAPPQRSRLATLALKWFFFVMSLGLTVTTALGIYLAFKYNRDQRALWGMLAIGAAIPVVLLLL